MKKKRSPQMMIAFLDTLSNAMAAILIIAIIQMHPKSGEGVAKGFPYVRAIVNGSEQNYHLEMMVKVDSLRIFSEQPSFKFGYRFLRKEGSIIMLINERIDANVRIYVFLERSIIEAPEVIDVLIDVSLPDKKVTPRKFELTLNNLYMTEIPGEMLK